MPNRQPLPTILQLPDCILPSTSTLPPEFYHISRKTCTTNKRTVLASPDHLPLLRPPLARPSLPRLLPDALLPPPRRILRSLSGALLLAPPLQHNLPDPPLSPRIHALPWATPLLNIRLHLVPAQPRHTTLLPGPTGLHSAVSAVGVNGLQSCGSWHDPEG